MGLESVVQIAVTFTAITLTRAPRYEHHTLDVLPSSLARYSVTTGCHLKSGNRRT